MKTFSLVLFLSILLSFSLGCSKKGSYKGTICRWEHKGGTPPVYTVRAERLTWRISGAFVVIKRDAETYVVPAQRLIYCGREIR